MKDSIKKFRARESSIVKSGCGKQRMFPSFTKENFLHLGTV